MKYVTAASQSPPWTASCPWRNACDAAHPDASTASRQEQLSVYVSSCHVFIVRPHRNRLAALAVGVFHHDRLHADPDDPGTARGPARLRCRRAAARLPSEKIACFFFARHLQRPDELQRDRRNRRRRRRRRRSPSAAAAARTARRRRRWRRRLHVEAERIPRRIVGLAAAAASAPPAARRVAQAACRPPRCPASPSSRPALRRSLRPLHSLVRRRRRLAGRGPHASRRSPRSAPRRAARG